MQHYKVNFLDCSILSVNIAEWSYDYTETIHPVLLNNELRYAIVNAESEAHAIELSEAFLVTFFKDKKVFI